MTRHHLELLRAANPVRTETGYSAAVTDREIARILNNSPNYVGGDDHELVLPLADAEPARRRSRWVVVVAAASVAILAAVSAIAWNRGGTAGDAASSGTRTVSCAVSVIGGPHATRDREAHAAHVIATRVAAVGATTGKITSDARNGTIRFAPRGASSAKAQVCRAIETSIRPVVARPVVVDDSGPRMSDPLAALTFTVPATESAYTRLAPAQRTQLATAMSHFDCSGTAVYGSAALTCSNPTGAASVYLLGLRIAGGTDIRAATAHAPQAGRSAQWSVDIGFDSAAAARLHTYTGNHNAAGRSAAVARCGPAGNPCADFLAFSADDVIVLTPQTEAPGQGSIQLSGSLDQRSAETIATDFTAASIDLHAH